MIRIYPANLVLMIVVGAPLATTYAVMVGATLGTSYGCFHVALCAVIWGILFPPYRINPDVEPERTNWAAVALATVVGGTVMFAALWSRDAAIYFTMAFLWFAQVVYGQMIGAFALKRSD